MQLVAFKNSTHWVSVIGLDNALFIVPIYVFENGI